MKCTFMNEGSLNGEILPDGISLYIHIPFCKSKCPYCDFNTYQGIESLMPPYLDALALEIQLWGRTLGNPGVNTIFFGGGTPSYISLEHMEKALCSVADAFEVVPGVETTIEANPGDLNGPALTRLLEVGVNRLSIGVQSLDDSLLSMLGRRHTAQEAMEGYRLARQVGFESVKPGPDVWPAPSDDGPVGRHYEEGAGAWPSPRVPLLPHPGGGDTHGALGTPRPTP